MENPFDLMRAAMSQARAVFRSADDTANAMAWLMEGRLRKVDPSALKALKRELQDFNAHTGKWRE